jgi:hypothetical protein
MASFYDSASIITIPSGYKVGTLYSAKPTDGTGDMTFTRTGDTATRVNSAGIIERCITNAALQSNNFSSGSWAKSNVTIAGSIADPNGGTTAFSMAGTSATSNSKNIAQFPFAVVNQPKTLSIYAKANTHSFIQIRNSDPTNFSNFDLTTGTFSGGTALARMTSIGGGWYRCSISYTSSATGYVLHLVDSLAAAHGASSTTTNSVYIWRAQAESEDIPTNYIDTTTAAVTEGPVTNLPRLDYFGSTCPQLLMEPTRTNLATYSQMFDNSNWQKSTCSVSGNVAVSPDGYTNADVIVENTASGTHNLTKGYSFVSGTTYTQSVFVKQGSGDRRFMIILPSAAFTSNLICNFNIQTGVVTTSSGSITGKIENYGNGWYRCIATATATITATSPGNTGNIYLKNSNAATSSNYTGDGTSSLFIWGAQMEAGAYATSYIPTTAATVTRNNDDMVKTSITSLIGQTEGTLYFEGNIKGANASVNRRIFSISDGTTSNAINIQNPATNQRIEFEVTTGGFTQALISSANNSLIYEQKFKAAIAYKENDFVAYINGVQIGTDTSGSVPACSKVSFDRGNSTSRFEGAANQALVFKTRLSNTDLATLTTL